MLTMQNNNCNNNICDIKSYNNITMVIINNYHGILFMYSSYSSSYYAYFTRKIMKQVCLSCQLKKIETNDNVGIKLDKDLF